MKNKRVKYIDVSDMSSNQIKELLNVNPPVKMLSMHILLIVFGLLGILICFMV